jgi:hypothetical protein
MTILEHNTPMVYDTLGGHWKALLARTGHHTPHPLTGWSVGLKHAVYLLGKSSQLRTACLSLIHPTHFDSEDGDSVYLRNIAHFHTVLRHQSKANINYEPRWNSVIDNSKESYPLS